MRARKWMPLTDFRMFGHVMSNSSEIFTGTLQAILGFETRSRVALWRSAR